MTDTQKSITYTDPHTAAEAMDTMPAGAAVVVEPEPDEFRMFVKLDDVADVWEGVDCKLTAEEVASLATVDGTVDRIDLMPGVREWIGEEREEREEEEERRRREVAEWEQQCREAEDKATTTAPQRRMENSNVDLSDGMFWLRHNRGW